MATLVSGERREVSEVWREPIFESGKRAIWGRMPKWSRMISRWSPMVRRRWRMVRRGVADRSPSSGNGCPILANHRPIFANGWLRSGRSIAADGGGFAVRMASFAGAGRNTGVALGAWLRPAGVGWASIGLTAGAGSVWCTTMGTSPSPRRWRSGGRGPSEGNGTGAGGLSQAMAPAATGRRRAG